MADAVNLGDEPYLGGCHCGAVRFRFRAPAALEILACNCSICNLTGFLHVTVPHSAFVLLTPLDALSDYRFGSGAAAHLFCRVCGIKREPLDFKIDEIWPRPVEFSLRFFKPDRLLAACRAFNVRCVVRLGGWPQGAPRR